MPQAIRHGDFQLPIVPLAFIDPASQGVGAINTAWVSAAGFTGIAAIVQTGVLGVAATVDAKLQRANDNVGTGAADVRAITQIVKASGDNQQAIIVVDAPNQVNGFVRLVVTVGGAASQLSATLFGAHGSAIQSLPASVAQIAR